MDGSKPAWEALGDRVCERSACGRLAAFSGQDLNRQTLKPFSYRGLNHQILKPFSYQDLNHQTLKPRPETRRCNGCGQRFEMR